MDQSFLVSVDMESICITLALQVCHNCDIKISELMSFFDVDRPHMQQGLFPDIYQSCLIYSNLVFDEVTLRALAGAPLKSNDMLKLEQTFLADIIVEEEGNEHLRQVDTLHSIEGKEVKIASEGQVTSTLHNTITLILHCIFPYIGFQLQLL